MQKNYRPRRSKKSSRSVPDAAWIRREIPIADVARALGLQGDGRLFDCPREEHPRGKKQRSLSVHGESNTVRCFACDERSLSNISLVMAVNGLDVGGAIRWLAGRFPGVPLAKVRINGGNVKVTGNGSQNMSLQDLIVSPGWAAFSPAAKIVLTAIFSRAPKAGSEQGQLRCTYTLLTEWTGLRGRSTISKALEELREAGAIKTHTVTTNLRSKRGFWLKQLLVRVSPRALNATSYSVQKMDSQYTVQNLDSASRSFGDSKGGEGVRIQ